MNTIKRLETMEMEPLTNRSVDPLPQRTRRLPQLPKIPTSKTMAPQGVLLDAQARSSFFPAHYFDYIGGTSTGGYGRLGKAQIMIYLLKNDQAHRHHAGSSGYDRRGMPQSL